MSEDNVLFEFAGAAALGAVAQMSRLPAHALMTAPYKLALDVKLDRVLDKLADKIEFNADKCDPVKLEEWVRNLYADSTDFRVNFNRREQYKNYLFDPKKFPGAHIPVPPNLERGVLHYGKLHNEGTTKDNWLTGLHFNPELWADAYRVTRGRALIIGGMTALTASAAIFYAMSGYVGFSLDAATFTSQETWGSLGAASSFSMWNSVKTAGSALLGAVILIPSVLPLFPRVIKTLSTKIHDVMALNETLIDIEEQIASYGGNEASKEEVSLFGGEGSNAIFNSRTLAKQRAEFWRVYNKGEPMIYFNKDDGTAQARGSIHGYEAGTGMWISLSDLNQNVLGTGKIGSGKTTSVGLPLFDRILEAFLKSGYPIQGFGLDGKATIYHKLMKILKKRGMSGDRFIPVGVDEGQYGIPIFHGLSVEKCVDILGSTTKGDADPFFVPSALSQIERVLRIAKAYHQTPLGVDYEIESGGCTVDSPEWVKRLCNNPDILYKVITELTECLQKNEALRYALYDPSLKSALDGCLEDWRNMLASTETASSVVSTINVFLKDFTSNGKILERFGQGRIGPMYKDLSLCLNGYFFFSALADTEYGEAARKINIFARSRLFNLITLREIQFKLVDKDPQEQPVVVFIDEHHLMASSGTTGLSDASIMNISRSMGLVFIAMTQSTDAYETVLGKIQTENMVQQQVNRVYLPSSSEALGKAMAESSGTGYRLGAISEGIYATEGYRELMNGGVIKKPRTSISELSAYTPLGLPSTVTSVDRKLLDKSATEMHSFGIFGYFGKRFKLGSGVQYIDKINSPAYIAEARHATKMRRHTFNFGESLGAIPNREIKQSKEEAASEVSGRSDGIERVPLFTNNDLISTGNYRAIQQIQQFGVQHICRVETEPMFI